MLKVKLGTDILPSGRGENIAFQVSNRRDRPGYTGEALAERQQLIEVNKFFKLHRMAPFMSFMAKSSVV
jgi:hypothetical protein